MIGTQGGVYGTIDDCNFNYP